MPAALAAAGPGYGKMIGGSVGGIAGIVTGIIGENASEGDRQKARDALGKAVALIEEVGAPPDLSARIIIEKLRQVGIYSPEMENQITVGVAKASEIQEDAQFKDAQINALQQMKLRTQGGLAPEDVAMFNQLRQQNAADVQGKLGQVRQQFAARGQGGSGQELAAQLSAAQSGAGVASAEGDRIAAARSLAKQQALAQMGQMATQVRGQEFGQKYQQAQAADAFKQFDTANAVNRQARNVQAQNTAQQQNLATAQRVSDVNTQWENQERYRQAQAKRDYWNDQLKYAQARSQAQTGIMAPMYQNEADRITKKWAGMGQSIGNFAGAAGEFADASGGSASGGGKSGGNVTPANNGQPTNDYDQEQFDLGY